MPQHPDHLAHLDALLGPVAVLSLSTRGLIPALGTGPAVAGDTPLLADRVAGALLGTAYGSALGLPFEWLDPRQAPRRAEQVPDPRPGARDAADVQLLRRSLVALADHGLAAAPALAAGLPAARLRNPGNAVAAAQAALAGGAPWFEAGVGSWGNGAAVRAVAAGVAMAARPDWRPVAAALDCAVTHATPEAVAVSAAVAETIALLLAAPPGVPGDALLAAVTAGVPAALHNALHRAVGMASAAPGRRLPHGPAEADGALAAALAHLLRHGDDPVRAVRSAVAAGGDTDTVAALVGAFVGASHGAAAFPPAWRSAVRSADRMEQLASSAAAALGAPAVVSPGGPSGGRSSTSRPGGGSGGGASATRPGGRSSVRQPGSTAEATAGPGAGDDEHVPLHIHLLLDRSGSMASIADDVVGGYNAFLAEHRAAPGACRLTLVQFDSQDPAEVLLRGVDIAAAPDLTPERFQPRGSTPLYDAIGHLLDRAEADVRRQRATGLADEDHLIVILTDGYENASRSWTQPAVFERIAGLEASGWTFAYLGANQDAFAVGGGLGVHHGSTDAWLATPDGARAAFDKTSKAALAHRARTKHERFLAKERFFTAEDDDSDGRP